MIRQTVMAALLALAAMPVRAEMPTAEIPARIELHAVPTQTLSDREFLTGKDGKPATVTGELRIAQGTGRLPVVVMMHGSGGMSPALDTWSRQFNAMGVSTLAMDGFTAAASRPSRPTSRSSAGSTSSWISTARWRCWPSIRGSIRSASS